MATRKWRPSSVVILVVNVLFLFLLTGAVAGGAVDQCWLCPAMSDCGICPYQDAKFLFAFVLVVDVILGAYWLLGWYAGRHPFANGSPDGGSNSRTSGSLGAGPHQEPGHGTTGRAAHDDQGAL